MRKKAVKRPGFLSRVKGAASKLDNQYLGGAAGALAPELLSTANATSPNDSGAPGSRPLSTFEKSIMLDQLDIQRHNGKNPRKQE